MLCKPIKKMDDELRAELAEIKNMICSHNMILAKVNKQISAEVAINATKAGREVEIARLQKTALNAIRRERLLTDLKKTLRTM